MREHIHRSSLQIGRVPYPSNCTWKHSIQFFFSFILVDSMGNVFFFFSYIYSKLLLHCRLIQTTTNLKKNRVTYYDVLHIFIYKMKTFLNCECSCDFIFNWNDRRKKNALKFCLRYCHVIISSILIWHVFARLIEYNCKRYLSGIIVLMNVILLNIYISIFLSRNAINSSFQVQNIGKIERKRKMNEK